MNAHGRFGGIAPLILKLCTRWGEWSAFYSWGKRTPSPLYRMLGGNNGGFGQERNLLLLSEIVDCPAHSLVTIPTELSQLLASVIYELMIMKQWWNDTDGGKPKYWERNMS
jgi:hypothetical protein